MLHNHSALGGYMKLRDLLINLQTLALNNPDLLDTTVEVTGPAVGLDYAEVTSLELSYEDVEDEGEGTTAEPTGVTITVM
jgi:hypothetical protein